MSVKVSYEEVYGWDSHGAVKCETEVKDGAITAIKMTIGPGPLTREIWIMMKDGYIYPQYTSEYATSFESEATAIAAISERHGDFAKRHTLKFHQIEEKVAR